MLVRKAGAVSIEPWPPSVSGAPMTASNRPPRNARPGALFLAALLSLLLAAGTIWQVRSLVLASRWVDHSDWVLAQSHEVEKGVLQLESGLRGYVLTGDESFLAPYQQARTALPDQLATLDALTADNAEQQRRLGAIRESLGGWFAISGQVISARAAGGQAQEMIGSGRVRRQTHAVLEKLQAFDETEQRLRDVRSTVAVRRADVTEAAAGAMLVVLAVLLAWGFRQRRRWEGALIENEKRFRAIADQVQEYGIFLLDRDGNVRSWGQGAQRIKGYSEAEVIGRPYAIFFTEEDRAAGLPAQLLRRAAAEGHVEHKGWRVRKDGSRFWADAVLTALHDSSGALTGFAKVTRDLTQAKLAEERARVAEAQFRTVVEAAHDAIVVVGETGAIEFANPQALRWLGYSREELLGQGIETIIPARFRERHVAHRSGFQAAPRSRAMGAGLELFARRKDGSEFPVDVSLSPSPAVGRAGTVTTAIIRDVSEQKRIAQRQRLFSELGNELSKTLDADAVRRRIPELVVPALADWAALDVLDEKQRLRRLAVVHADPAKRGVAEALRERWRSEHGRTVRQVIETGAPVRLATLGEEELQARVGDPEIFALLRELGTKSFLVVPLSARGRILGALTLATSGRVLTEEDLIVAGEIAQRGALVADNARLFQEAQRLVQLRDEMVGIVSHDLRNPINAIRLNAQVLRRVYEKAPADSASREKLEQLTVNIERAADSGNRLITDLLDSARIDAGTLMITPAPVDLGELVREAADGVRPLAASKGLELELSADPPGAVVRCDRERMLQVLSNLLGNAIKFTPEGGRVAVRAQLADGEATIAVQDTGRGISEHELPHIFDRFWQAKETHRLGAGLGLSIAKGIIEAHGGRIWAESEPGLGSTFSFTLPAPRQGEAESSLGAPQRSTVG